MRAATTSLASRLHLLLFFLPGWCDSRASIPALQHASSDKFLDSSFPALGGTAAARQEIDLGKPPRQLPQPRTWDDYILNGERLYDVWRSWQGADTRTYLPLDETPRPRGFTPVQVGLLREIPMPTNPHEWSEYVYHSRAFDHVADPLAGTDPVSFRCQVIADPSTVRPDRGPPGGMILVTEWSPKVGPGDCEADDEADFRADVLWAMWRDEVKRKRAPVDDLRQIGYDPVTGPRTLELLKYALDQHGFDDAYSSHRAFGFPSEPEPGYASFDDGDWALLGSPAGTTVSSLLTRHKRVLGGKRVTTIFPYCGPIREWPDPPEPLRTTECGLLFTLGKPNPEFEGW